MFYLEAAAGGKEWAKGMKIQKNVFVVFGAALVSEYYVRVTLLLFHSRVRVFPE